MVHSISTIWIHAVWATKYRTPLIYKPLEQRLYPFISEQFKEMGCPIKIVNGMPDHIHCLFLLSRQKAIAEVIKQVKGSSAHFINKNKLITEKFAWQNGYSAFSVSRSDMNRVFHYIKNQKSHHQSPSPYPLAPGLNPGLGDRARGYKFLLTHHVLHR